MASTAATQTPAAPSRLGSFFGALGLLRESPIGMLGAAILLFWVTMAILAPDPAAARPQPGDRPVPEDLGDRPRRATSSRSAPTTRAATSSRA